MSKTPAACFEGRFLVPMPIPSMGRLYIYPLIYHKSQPLMKVNIPHMDRMGYDRGWNTAQFYSGIIVISHFIRIQKFTNRDFMVHVVSQGFVGSVCSSNMSEYSGTPPNFFHIEPENDGFQKSKVVSTHLWNTPLNLYQQAVKGFLS